MKNFIRFLDAEFNADSKIIILFIFWTFFDSEIKYSSHVDQNS